LLSFDAATQLSVIIDQSPDYTPTEDSLYLVGSFNNWNPQDSNFLFKPLSNGRYVYDFLTPLPDFEFKITRGSWKRVEGGALGEPIGNRLYQSSHELRDTIHLLVKSWEDLREAIPYFDTIQLRVTEIPENTPIDATLYVVGNFNGWSPADPGFKLHAAADGSYFATIPLRSDTMEFKISRGSWAAIESRKNGLALPNRRYLVGEDDLREIQEISIANWEDLAGNQLRWHSFILLLAAIQGILLLFAINSFKVSNRVANYLLSALIGLVALTFLARLGAFNRQVFQQFPKLILLPDLIYFLYAPFFWLYLKALLANSWDKRRHLFWYFLPFFLAFLAYIPLLLKDKDSFTSLVVSQQLKDFSVVMAMIGWFFSFYYWLKAYRLFRRLEVKTASSDRSSLNFIGTMMKINALCLLLWLSTFLVGGLSWYLRKEWTAITDTMTDISWSVLAFGIFAMGYYVIRQPLFFRNPQLYLPPDLPLAKMEATEVDLPPVSSPDLGGDIDTSHSSQSVASGISDDDLSRLEEMMAGKKPYLNPGLSLSELADLMSMPSHQLSKIINDGFQKNFFDYINTYRIEAFKERIANDEHQERTILSIALDVGFNSKTAFNRAFKKHTQLTPRQYLRELKDPS
jgi:AraC-like DNA-binding protein